MERDIQTKESSLAKLDKELATKYEDGNVPEEFFEKYEKLKTELASLHKEWEALYLDLES